jgi:hypothetical protein
MARKKGDVSQDLTTTPPGRETTSIDVVIIGPASQAFT